MTGKPQIEKGVPIPTIVQRERYRKYPIREMQVGDSFFVPGKTGKGSTLSNIGGLGKHYGVKLSVRAVEGGARVWRIE